MSYCKILIADDEQLAREAIKLQLQDIPGLQILESADGRQAIESLVNDKPDIVFLDIQMPLFNGLEVLKNLPENYQPFIIFVTAHDMYALQAFENDAIDYLLKPFTDQRFAKAFNKARDLWKSKTDQTFTSGNSLFMQLKRVISQLEQTDSQATITVRDGAKIHVLKLLDIMYIGAAGDYISVYTSDKKYLHKDTLANMELVLPASRFVRIHKSTIVNCAFIKELHSHFNGDYSVLLNNKQELKLSRNYRERLLEALG